MPIDYSKSKIYCIRNPNIDLIYIGQRVSNFLKRMVQHCQDLRREHTITSKVILEAYNELFRKLSGANNEELKERR